MRTETFEQVLQSMDPDCVCFAHHLAVAWRTAIRRANGDVIGLYAEVLEAFLDGDADGTAPAPEADHEVRSNVITSYSIHYTKLYDKARLSWPPKKPMACRRR